jgi:hypothetical protein
MVNFYVKILKKLKTSTYEEVCDEIATTLPQLSKIGSQDDMSISLIYDSERVVAVYQKLLEWQIESTKVAIAAIDDKIVDAKKRISLIEQSGNLTNKTKIDYDYAVADLNRAYADKEKLVKRVDVISQELHKYMDEAETLAENSKTLEPSLSPGHELDLRESSQEEQKNKSNLLKKLGGSLIRLWRRDSLNLDNNSNVDD